METKFTQLLMSSSERKAFTQFSFTDSEELLEYLFKHRLLLLVDWKEKRKTGRSAISCRKGPCP